MLWALIQSHSLSGACSNNTHVLYAPNHLTCLLSSSPLPLTCLKAHVGHWLVHVSRIYSSLRELYYRHEQCLLGAVDLIKNFFFFTPHSGILMKQACGMRTCWIEIEECFKDESKVVTDEMLLTRIADNHHTCSFNPQSRMFEVLALCIRNISSVLRCRDKVIET